MPQKGKPAKYIILQTSIGDYRQAVLQLLAGRYGADFLVLAGKEYFDGTTKTRIKLGDNFRLIRNFFFLKRFSFQLDCWKSAIAAYAVIFEGNPRIFSTWMLLGIRRALGRRSALWCHAWSRKGPHKGGTFLRDAMCKLAGVAVAYTGTEAAHLRERLPGVEVVCAPNSLYARSDIRPAEANLPPWDILYVGRLVAEKKPQLLLEAFIRVMSELPSDARLKFVGAGPQQPLLEKMAIERGVGKRVLFMGHVGGYADIRKEYETALVCVSPGYIGLSIIQALSFGVPMITGDDEPHAPEIEAAIEGENSLFFRSDDPEDLARAISAVFKQKERWTDRRRSISAYCAENYSAEKMAQGLSEAFGCRD